jgi:anti-sigma factor RsiW
MTPTSHDPAGRRCAALLAELFDYIDGELTPIRCRALEQHLASCTCCGTLAGNLRKAIALCREEGRRQLPTAVRNRARQRVKALLDDVTAR